MLVPVLLVLRRTTGPPRGGRDGRQLTDTAQTPAVGGRVGRTGLAAEGEREAAAEEMLAERVAMRPYGRVVGSKAAAVDLYARPSRDEGQPRAEEALRKESESAMGEGMSDVRDEAA
mmetsp:Transcript_43275/g.107664  ORF Transcript_43275/g.107664 Transcript_43275/m.107664 type:complete len:117 (-) Transcript_43275:107-457(-)